MFETVFESFGHLGTRALKAIRHLGARMALGHSGTQGTWALRHLCTRALEGHLGFLALEHLRALEPLYLADSFQSYIMALINARSNSGNDLKMIIWYAVPCLESNFSSRN